MAMLLPAAVFSRLYEIFAASMFGSTSKFASPTSVDSGRTSRRRLASSATSPCISPSTSRSGARSRSNASVSRILIAVGALLVPKFECDSSAIFGAMPKRRTSSAAMIVISQSCSGVGSTFTCVSTMKICRPGSTSAFIAA
ncbi:hypothetical protein AWB69_09255 [Caballeronia udeis]|uniref:Uncharacterized protein n=1 Tax=Caballeronia udeis TaxID=1232866 RepID=A0A158K336_9BURK|nr:hypothetical protein AWB69_09255 [Caballeronia udeis]